jgi:DNA-directed RNA polymerase specialized sigma24 family protein
VRRDDGSAGGAMTYLYGLEVAADFESIRSRVFGIAYRMLGRAADAEDVVQDVWVRWQGADQASSARHCPAP